MGAPKKSLEERLENYKVYGWKCNETNLKTLPPSAPRAAHKLAEWLTLEGRRSTLQEWLDAYERSQDGRIHATYWPIGAWTHRMSHSGPNMAVAPSPWPGDKAPETAVEEIKAQYDTRLRELWNVEEGNHLVGTDAESIQLRILAHYMDNEEFTKAVSTGDKKNGTDAHTMNMKALGSVCKDRDTAKTFIYAFLLGAGVDKVAEILNCNRQRASRAIKDFLSFYPDLKRLKEHNIPRDARNGFFVGLDGRKVKCDSEHLMLSGYLQNGEAVVMKRSNTIWLQKLDSMGLLKYVKQVNFVHDEWQTEVTGDEDLARKVGQIQCEAITQAGLDLGVKCPLSGDYGIGKNWAETH